MKKGVHPSYKKVTVIMTDGTSYQTLDTRGTTTFKTDIDSKSHNLWRNKQENFFDKGGQLDKFKKRFNKK